MKKLKWERRRNKLEEEMGECSRRCELLHKVSEMKAWKQVNVIE